MNVLETYVRFAQRQQASDLHLEPNLPIALRIRGQLEVGGPATSPETLERVVRELLGEQKWAEFLERRSFDLSCTVQGVRCRIHALRTQRGIGLAIRLLSGSQPTLTTLNLHPSLAELVGASHGLVVVSGPAGSGKSSTLAGLIHEINVSRAVHIVTIESPIEYVFQPRRAFIRQREVGFDTPSFRQGVLDVLREDPDVIMVGEMREPETIRLTLNAAETGHLVLTTLHASTVSDAVARIVAAFPADIQAGVSAQLADCLGAVVTQRLVYRPDLGIRVPELEILRTTPAVRATIRQGQFYKLASALQTGAADGMFSLDRYREWLASRSDWYRPRPTEAEPIETATPRPAPEAAPEIVELEPPAEDLEKILSEMESFRRRSP
jgi:twitching motility protein PilT